RLCSSQYRHLHYSTLFPYTTLFRSISNRRFTGGPHDYGYGATMSNAITEQTAEQPAPRVKRSHVTAWAMWDWGSAAFNAVMITRSEEHTSELQSRFDLVCRLLLEKQ